MGKEHLDDIPDDWMSFDEAVRHIMAVEECSKKKAEALLLAAIDDGDVAARRFDS